MVYATCLMANIFIKIECCMIAYLCCCFFFSFVGEDQMDMSDQLVCLDPVYNVLWGYVIGNCQLMSGT